MSWNRDRHSDWRVARDRTMPASQTGFINFLDRNIGMQSGYQIPGLACPPALQQHQTHHLAAMAAGVPIAYSGLQGYSFIPYPHHRHLTQLSNAFDLKATSPYHHALLARGAPFYAQYRPGASDDPSRIAKVATRESTSALKAWLNEHLKNPYPTKGEKIMLAIITKMSLTQVSTWFANARRRLKKENRVSWASKGKSDEEDEEDEEDESAMKQCRLDEQEEILDPQMVDGEHDEDPGKSVVGSQPVMDASPQPEISENKDISHGKIIGEKDSEQTSTPLESKENVVCQKPKIWSLAETATSETVRKHTDNIYHPTSSEVGKLWAEWASRNGLFVPSLHT